MQTLIQDIHFSLRQLFKNPRFTLTAVISLALGIGATTAVFSVIYAALVNPYPYPAADRIVRLTATSKSDSNNQIDLNGPQVIRLMQVPVVDSVLAMDYHPMTITGHEFPENVDEIGLISTGFNDLGLPPLLGRGIMPSDAPDGQDPQPVTVLSYRFWQKHFFRRSRPIYGPDAATEPQGLHPSSGWPRHASPGTWATCILPGLKIARDPGTRLMVDGPKKARHN